MTSDFTFQTGLCDLCCCHRVITRSVLPQKLSFQFMKSGSQLHEAISINTYGYIPTRQVRIYSCIDARGTVGIRTPKYNKEEYEIESWKVDRLGKQGKDKERLVGVIRRSP